MRPLPPPHIVEPMAPLAFRPAVDVEQWLRGTFIDEGSALVNEAHAHLRQAEIGVLWTNVPMKRRGRSYLGTCEAPTETAATWSKARGEWQIRQWFDGPVDFLITLYAPACAEMTDRAFMALCEHELLHAAHKLDDFGQPQYDRQTGRPKFALAPHSFEEFVGVVERYGATSPELRIAAESIMAGPLLDDEALSIACMACARK